MPQRHSPRDEIKWTVHEKKGGGILTFTNILPPQVNLFSSISPPVGSRTNLVKMASNRIEANLCSVVYNKTWDKNLKIIAEHLIGLKTLSLSLFLLNIDVQVCLSVKKLPLREAQ